MIRYIYLLGLFLIGCGPRLTINCPDTKNYKAAKLPMEFVIDDRFSDYEKQAIEDAMEAWNSAMGRTVLVRSSGGYPVFLSDSSEFTGQTQAVTSTSSRNSIILNTLIRVNSSVLNRIDIESLMIHEFGHALGLEHTENTVMNPTLANNYMRRNIDKRSINALRCLYGKAP